MLQRKHTGRIAVGAVLSLTGGVLLLAPLADAAPPSVVTQTFNYTGSTATFTVPANITQLTVTALGGQGGQGGNDANGASPTGGYQGLVSGTLTVTPGQVLTIGVGNGGATGTSSGHGNNNAVTYTAGAAAGGANPLGGYAGGNGGVAGWQGSSGFGGGGGAATVIQTSGSTIIAGGSGGAGGSGQYLPLVGRAPASTYSARSDTTSTSGQTGISVYIACQAPGSTNCDGGGGGAGGGGAQGGAQGDVQFGSGVYNEWYGYGGFPGQNSTASLVGLTAGYQYYSGNNAGGSVTISYTTGAPDVPTALAGDARNTAVALNWDAPSNTGGAAISDYVVQYAPASSPTSWVTFSHSASASTSALVTGLTNDTAYIFQVAAVNSFGTSAYSSPSASVTPTGPPAAPTISAITPADGALSVAYTAGTSGSPILGYEYQINGAGSWYSAGSTTSPFTISGLVNGTTYSVTLRAVSAIGTGAASTPVSGTPVAAPGAPNITSVATSIGSATVAFTPGYTGGATITGYDYRLNGGSWVSAGTTTSPITINGLANGTTYSVTIRATTAGGTGASSPSASITTPGVPSAPTVNAITPGDQSLSIAFSAGNSGGSPVTAYQYQLTSGGAWTTASSLSSPIIVSGLTNGTTYAVSVRAVNAVGTGAASTPQAATPATVPSAPTIVGSTVAGSNLQLDAAFTAPLSDGGSAITTYQYSTDAGATWQSRSAGTTASPLTITAQSGGGALVNGTTYYVELRAVNAVGPGAASAVATGIAQTTPSAPTITTVTPASQSLQVSFSPASNGGAAITSYEYRLGSGAWTNTGTLGTSFTINGLTNGTTYAVSVRGVNSQGNGAASTPVSATPATVPDAPTITSITRANQSLTISFNPGSDGGAAISGWQYSTDGGATWAFSGQSTTPLIITTLSSNSATISNGTSYPIAIRAVNLIGAGGASAITNVGPSTTPSAPTVSLTPLDQAIRVAFAVTNDGGSPISAIEYRLNGGAWTDAGTLASPFTIGSLTNGTPYSVEVRADNVIGSGASSTPASATPRTVPGAPTSVDATSNTSAADVTWAAPTSSGGSAVTSYTASAFATSSSSTALATCTSSTFACSVTGLTNGTTYYVSVVATNVAGTGVASAPRTVVTPLVRPGAPTLNTLTPGNAFVTLAFTAGSAGSSSITGYQYQLNGGTWQNTSATTSPLTISGLTNGTAYAVALRAVSAAGVGVASSTLTTTPFTYPDAPDGVTANGTGGSAIIAWNAPNNNGSAITSYTATAFSALTAGTQIATCTTSGALTCTITGLTNGTTYYISLQAQNAAGLSTRSAPRVPVTPSLQPGAVTNVTGASGNGQVVVSWTPGSTGGSAITDYTIWYSSGGAYTQFADGTSTATSATVTGLTNGTAYTFKVYAVNANGTGPASAASIGVVPLAPGTVPTFSAPVRTVDGFTFTISNYDAGTTYGLSTTNGATVNRTGATVTVTGLTAGAASTVSVGTTLAGYTYTSGTVASSALNTGTTPTFSTPVRTVDGYTLTISNYDPATTYGLSATNGATVTRTGAAITVTGLGANASSTVTVNANLAGYTNTSSTVSGTSLATGTVPTFSTPVRTVDGFTFTISNYDAGTTYGLSATNGATVNRTGAAITVTGLAANTTSTVTVNAARVGYTDSSAAVTGTSLATGTVPTFATPVRTVDGYTVTISNYDPATTYGLSATNGATVNRTGAAITVTGLGANASSTVTVNANLAGYTNTSGTVSGTSLATGTVPTFGPIIRTLDGYTVTISNYDPATTYGLSATNGATVNRTGAVVTITGLAANTSSTVTASASLAGYTNTSAPITGTSMSVGTAPTFSTPVRTADGFTFTISNYNPALDYTFGATGEAIVVNTTGTVTVTGLAPGAASAVTVTATDPGQSSASAVANGTALLTGLTPVLSAATMLDGAFETEITNYDSATVYAESATNGATVSRTGAVLTVSGLAPGGSSTVTVSAARTNYTSTSASRSGVSLALGAVPTFSVPTSTADGFTLDINNYSFAVTYAVSANNGAQVTLNANHITVTGLTPAASSTVAVITTQSGHLPGVGTVNGSADAPLPVVLPPTLAPVASPSPTNSPTPTVSPTSSGATPTESPAPRPEVTQPPAIAPTVKSATPSPSSTRSDVTRPQAPAARPGQGVVTVNGRLVVSTLTSTETTVTLSAGGVSVTLSAVRDGHALVLPDGKLTVSVGGQLHLWVGGLRSESQAIVWTLADPKMLATLPISSDHEGTADFTLPSSLTAGDHTLVLTGTSADGKKVTMSLGLTVTGSDPVKADRKSSDNNALWYVLAPAGLLALLSGGFFLILFWRRRHRDDEVAAD